VPAALAGAGLVLLTYLIAKRCYDERVGWLAGAITATSFGYVSMARQALPDLPLSFFITLTTWAALEACGKDGSLAGVPRSRWLTISAAAAAGGLLMKGPVALLLPGLIVAVTLAIQCRANARAMTLRLLAPGITAWGAAIAIFLALAVPWYGAMVTTHGTWYLQHFFFGENVERFATARYNEPRPIWFYVPVALGGLLPWTGFGLLTIAPVARAMANWRTASNHAVTLIVWAAVPLLFYSVSIGKQPRYILPILPPIAVAIAAAIANAERDANRLHMRAGATVTALLFVVVAASIVRLTPFLDTAGYGGGRAGGLLVGGIGIAALLLTWVTPLPRIADIFAVAAAGVFVVVNLVVLAPNRPEGVKAIAAALQRVRTGDEPVATYRAFVRNLIFYTHVRQVPLLDVENAVSFLQSEERVFCVLDREEAEHVARVRHLRLRHLATASYFDPSRLRLGDVIDPDPSRIGTAVLVTNQ
jgi:4-amino-4-deoxy-L-arabinose transferase-like glycosyltransferase